ncbi:MAG TPA: hypothetical protein VIX35_02250, partial [Vicinamibacterales bacterium]
QVEAYAKESRLPRGPAADTGSIPVDFVCEEDVRLAIKAGQRIGVHERTIITPSARDLGEAHKIFVKFGRPGPLPPA